MISPVLPVYKHLDVAVTRGEGCFLYSADGKQYLDFIAGIAVHAFGHLHPRLVTALTTQAQKLWHISGYLRSPEQEKAAAKLVRMSGFADTVFFTNSGVEAWECGVKIIRRHFWAKGEARRHRIITATNSFHGRTIAAISAAGAPRLVDGFAPLADGFDQVPFGDIAALEKAITPATAGVCLEPLQGEGGVIVPPAGYLKAVRALCDKHGLLLMLDEIQCGLGRTGTLWAYAQHDIRPDVLSTAKALGGGFPVGACLATEDAASAMTAGTHGSTYGGNPLAMAMVNEVLDMLSEDGLFAHVTRMGAYLTAGLKQLVTRFPDHLVETRGLGLLQGVVLRAESYLPMQKALCARGLLTVGAGKNVIRFLPPLIVTETEVDAALGILADACANPD